jgi:hypothetical protein
MTGAHPFPSPIGIYRWIRIAANREEGRPRGLRQSRSASDVMRTIVGDIMALRQPASLAA